MMNYKLWLETIVRYNSECVIIVDKDANLVYYDDPKAYFFNKNSKKEDFLGKNIINLLEDITEEDSVFYRVLRTGEPVYDYMQTFVNYAKKRVTALSTMLPLIEDNKIVGALEILNDINNFNKLHKKMTEISKDDTFKISNGNDRKTNGITYSLGDIIGESSEMKALKEKIVKVADSTASVLVHGETGTGKELVVQAIHESSFKRKNRPFIAQNCAAIPNNLLESILFGTTSGSFTGSKEKPGLFELADGGSLLLDEINSMDIDLQAKLLRVLQTGEIMRVGGNKTIKLDVRVMTTSNVDPLEAVKLGKLRQDLYYRLNVINLLVPPLRNRKDDIELLIHNFIELYNESFGKNVIGITDECKKAMLAYDWPGNIRELRYTIESIMIFVEKDIIDISDLPTDIVKPINIEIINNKDEYLEILPLKDTLRHVEINLIKKALTASGGNQAKAAKMLEIPRQTLFNKISKYEIKGNVFFN